MGFSVKQKSACFTKQAQFVEMKLCNGDISSNYDDLMSRCSADIRGGPKGLIQIVFVGRVGVLCLSV